MIAIDADHVAQTGLHAGFKSGVIRRVRRIARSTPITVALKPPVPQKQFSDQNNIPSSIARAGKRRRVRIMRAANEIEAGVLHQLHVAEKPLSATASPQPA